MNKQKRNKSMKNSAITLALIATMSLSPVMAKDVEAISKHQQKIDNENIGFGTGVVIGAVVAGPLGAIVTGLVGAFTAKHLNAVNENDELTEQISSEQSQHQLALEKYQQKLQRLEQGYQNELLALQKNQQNTSQLQAENLLMSLQFSTGSSELKPHYEGQINSLVSLLKQAPDLSIDLSGYTDLQGSDELNHALSIARVNAVKHALLNQGVEAERINLFAFGEKSPVVANNEKETSFYDRRVVIKLKKDNGLTLNSQTVSNY